MTSQVSERERRIHEAYESKVRLYAIIFGGVAVVILVVLRVILSLWLQDGPASSITVGLLDALISTAVVGACLTVFSTIVQPASIDELESAPVEASAISSLLKAAAQSSTSWEYHGHTGRFVRSKIFPILRQRTQDTNTPLRVRVALLDPRSSEVVAHYSKYRKQARSGARREGENWEIQQIRRELLATLLCVAELHSLDLRFDVEVRLVRSVGVLRYDVADDLIVVTEEDPRRPGFKYAPSHSSYELFRRMINLGWTQANVLALPDFDRPIPFNEMTLDEAKRVIAAMGAGADNLSDDDVVVALDLYKQRSSPY